MFRTPLETTVGKILPSKKLNDLLEVALVSGHLSKDLIEEYPAVVPLLDNGIEVDTIPPFGHPIKVRDNLVIDLRAFKSKIERANTDRILYEGAVGLLVKQAALQQLWQEDPEYLFEISDLPIQVYAHWLGESISQKLNLNPADNQTMVIACAWFYTCLFLDSDLLRNGQLDEAKYMGLVARISRVTYGTIERVLEITDNMGVVTNIDEFIRASGKLGILRLNVLNIGTLITWIGNSWFGNTSAKEMVSIAVEYPPYFIGILHTAVTESTYRRTRFNDIALRYKRNDAIRRFDIAVRSTLKQLKD